MVITLRNVDDPIGDVEFFVEPPFDFEEDEDEVAFFEAAYTELLCESKLVFYTCTIKIRQTLKEVYQNYSLTCMIPKSILE